MKIIAAFAASAVASLALLAAPPAAAQKSTAFQIDPTHAGSTVFPGGLRLPLEIAWSRKWPVPHGNFNEVSYPLIVDGRVFFTVTPFGTQKHGAQMIGTLIYGLSLQDGRLLWKKHLPDDYHWSALAYDNGRLFVTAGDGIVAALDPDTGRPIWRRRIRDPNTWSLVSPPTAADGRIFFSGSGNQGTLFALDQATGTELWKSRVKGSASGAATVVGDSVFVAYSDHVYRFDTATGATRWYFNWGRTSMGHGNTAPFYADRIYANDSDGRSRMSSIDADTGVREFAFGEVSKPPAFYDGIGYFVTRSNLVARSTTTKRIRWQQLQDAPPPLPPLVVNGHVLTISRSAVLHVMDGKSGQILQALPLPGRVSSNAEGYGGLQKGMAAGDGMIVVPADDTLFGLRQASN